MSQLTTEDIWRELFAVFNHEVKWECQCPPERRGAEIALAHLLGLTWEQANEVTFGAAYPEDLRRRIMEALRKGGRRCR